MSTLLIIILSIFGSYLFTWIFIKIGVRLDKDKEVFPLPTEFFQFLIYPGLNLIMSLFIIFGLLISEEYIDNIQTKYFS